MVNWRYSLRHS